MQWWPCSGTNPLSRRVQCETGVVCEQLRLRVQSARAVCAIHLTPSSLSVICDDFELRRGSWTLRPRYRNALYTLNTPSLQRTTPLFTIFDSDLITHEHCSIPLLPRRLSSELYRCRHIAPQRTCGSADVGVPFHSPLHA